ncbi:ImpA family type VI secretion system protein [Enterobacter ludwigii]|nr:ImpA family type VI secretion system protein [Enterobacter ludwigii]
MNSQDISCPEWYQPALQSGTDNPPCGDSLEYDTTFIMLQSRLQPRLGAEYGDFVEAVEPFNWSEIERDAWSLLHRSKDIRLVIMLMRCRMRQIGVPAICEGIEALICMLLQWPDALHPQLLDEGEFVPILRANAFAELDAQEGFIADFRQLLLPKTSGVQLSVRDVERASTYPREEDALSESTMNAIKKAWTGEAAILSLQKAGQRLRHLHTILSNTLGSETPDFNRLFILLDMFISTEVGITNQYEPVCTPSPQGEESEVIHYVEDSDVLNTQTTAMAQCNASCLITNREDAQTRLREVRSWFVQNEPSSPVISLLAFTEQTIGKSFGELLQLLPPDLVVKLHDGMEQI